MRLNRKRHQRDCKCVMTEVRNTKTRQPNKMKSIGVAKTKLGSITANSIRSGRSAKSLCHRYNKSPILFGTKGQRAGDIACPAFVSVSQFFQMAGLIGKKSHCYTIDAIAQIGWRRPVGKNMSKMAATLAAVRFDLQIAVDRILFGPHCTVNRMAKARPAGVAFVFCLGNK